MKKECSILFLGKKNDLYVDKALQFCQDNFTDITSHLGKWKDSIPEDLGWWEGDYIISYLSRWIIPAQILEKPKKAAINFHPAPPNYPGFGCINFALYEEAPEYGVTCHHMQPKVDTGKIIATSIFPVFQTDNVATLLSRTYDHQLVLFYDIIRYIVKGEELPISNKQWERKPFTRKDFNQLEKITVEMSKEEIAKRIRATSFGNWKPTVEIQGFTFELK